MVLWSGEFLEDIIFAIKDKNAHVDILVSYHNPSEQNGGGYSDDMGGKALQGVIKDLLLKSLNGNESKRNELIKYLTIKQTRPDTYNHAKVWVYN